MRHYPGQYLRTKMAIAALAGGIALVGWSSLASRGSENPLTPEQAATVPATVVIARGRFEPAGGLVRAAAEAGAIMPYVSRLLIREDDIVLRGQITAELSTYPASRANRLIAQHELERARQRLAQLKAGPKPSEIRAQEALIRRDEAEQQFANSEERRAAELMRGDNISRSTMELRALATQRATATATFSRETLEVMREIKPSDVELAENDIGIAEARLAKAEADVEAALVRAPCDGRVLEIKARSGERPERELYVLADTSRMHVIAEIDEAQIDLVRIGQRAIVTPRGGQPLRAVIGRVGQLVKNEQRRIVEDQVGRDSRVVAVTVLIDPHQDIPEIVYREAVVAIDTAAGV
jgi:HlyD family secretion protein